MVECLIGDVGLWVRASPEMEGCGFEPHRRHCFKSLNKTLISAA